MTDMDLEQTINWCVTARARVMREKKIMEKAGDAFKAAKNAATGLDSRLDEVITTYGVKGADGTAREYAKAVGILRGAEEQAEVACKAYNEAVADRERAEKSLVDVQHLLATK